MKTTIGKFFILLSIGIAHCGYVCAQDANSFKSVLPHLKLLESGFPAVKNVDVSEYLKYEATPETGTFKFVGIVVTSDILKEKLGSIKPANHTMDAPLPPAVKNLIIYCDSLSLTDTLWLPQCNFDIHARVVNMHGKSINSSAIPWRKAVDRDAVGESQGDGRDGLPAGNISIICGKILEPGRLTANGTGGEWVYAPKVTVETPGTTSHIECYKNMGCSTQGKGSSIGLDKGKAWNYNLSAAVFKNEDHTLFDHEDCTGYVTWDKGGIDFRVKNGSNSAIQDNKEYSRIKAETKNKPGKGGRSGKITLYYAGQIPGLDEKGGSTGYYKPRANGNGITYSRWSDGKCTGIGIESHTYACPEIFVRSNWVGDLSITMSYSTGNPNAKVEVPSHDARNRFNNSFSWNAPNSSGESMEADVRVLPYTPHPEYSLVRTRYLQEQYSIYHKKTPEQQKALDKETNELLQQLANVIKDKTNDPAKGDYLTAYDRVLTLSQTSIKNIDDYNNAPGYRPLLSITSTLSYIKNNLEADLRLYVMSDIMARSEQRAGAFKQKIPGMLKDLYAANKGLSDKLVEINKKYDGLAINADDCEKKIEAVKKKLDSLEKKIEEQAKSDKTKMDILKSGIKICALAASVIPFGQPALGQIAGNGLNALADNIGGDPAKVAASVMEKVDMSGLMKSLAEKKLKKLKPEKLADKELIDISGMEKVPVDILTYNNNIVAEKHRSATDKYKGELDKTKETYTKAATGVKDIMAGYAKASVSTDEISKRIAELSNSSLLFQDIQGDLRLLTEQKEKIFSELSALMQESNSINSQIIENSDCITKLQMLNLGGLRYSEGLEDVMKDIRQASLQRLKWVEYQLVKVYEYTTLSSYKQKMPAAEILEEVYSRQRDTTTPANIDQVVKYLMTAYEGQQTIMGNQILSNISTSHKQDKKSGNDLGKYGRKILLTDDGDRSNEGSLLTDLNEHGTVTIDLQKDLIDEIIKPNESEVRIIDIALDGIGFGKRKLPKGTSLDVILDIEDGGVLRKNDAFYFFQTGSKEEAADRWKWTIRTDDIGNPMVTNESQLSSQYKDLIQFMTGSKSASGKEDNESLFTLPPAWSRCKIKLRYNSKGISKDSIPQIARLMFSVRCDYVDVTNASKSVLDIKLQNAPAGVLYTTSIDRTVQTNYTNFYDLVPNNKEITVELKEPADHASGKRKFIKWDVYGGHVLSTELSGKRVKLKLTDDTRVVAVYAETVPPRSAVNIPLYESPAADSRVVARINNMSEVRVLDDNINGFARVVYNGIQEAFVKR